VECFSYLGSVVNDARCTYEMKYRIVVVKAAFDKNIRLTNKFDLNLSIALYDTETGTFRKLDQKYLESFEMWCGKRLEKIIWTDRVKNGNVFHRIEARNILDTIRKSKANLIGHTSYVGTVF
jgi:hypothetical protein